jgi:hypothetical protein
LFCDVYAKRQVAFRSREVATFLLNHGMQDALSHKGWKEKQQKQQRK